MSEFERKSRSPRKARPRSLPALTELDVFANVPEIPLPTPEEKLRELSRSQPVTLVPIDTTAFSRISENSESQRSLSREYLDDGTTSISRRRQRNHRRRQTVAVLPSHVSSAEGSIVRKREPVPFRSMSRERWERGRPHSMAALDSYTLSSSSSTRQSRRRSKERVAAGSSSYRSRSRDLLYDDYDPEETNLARSCSLRRSLKSLFKGSRSKSGDLWVEGRPVSPGPPVVNLSSNMSNLKRSRSLPRSLKSMFRNSVGRLVSSSRSASTEGRLDSCDYDQEEEVDGAVRPVARSNIEVEDELVTEHVALVICKPNKTSKINRMVRSKSHHGCTTFTESEEHGRRPHSLDISPPGAVGFDVM